jgi:NAD(P)-dependent dehydrogenase (short-subunit alcohol dehydrogenase family)
MSDAHNCSPTAQIQIDISLYLTSEDVLSITARACLSGQNDAISSSRHITSTSQHLNQLSIS